MASGSHIDDGDNRLLSSIPYARMQNNILGSLFDFAL